MKLEVTFTYEPKLREHVAIVDRTTRSPGRLFRTETRRDVFVSTNGIVWYCAETGRNAIDTYLWNLLAGGWRLDLEEQLRHHLRKKQRAGA